MIPLIIICSVYGVKLYQDAGVFTNPIKSLAFRVHDLGKKIASRVDGGRVLTLTPIFPLEGGATIFEEFATGSFGWRAAHLVPVEIRQEVGLVAETDLEDFLASQPPAAIFVGYEGLLEQPFVEFARQNAFKLRELSTDKTLWLAPP